MGVSYRRLLDNFSKYLLVRTTCCLGIQKRVTNTWVSKSECKSVMVYTVEGYAEIKTHPVHFSARVKLLWNVIGNGQKDITSTKALAGPKL